ncbi:MAG: histidinol phosphate phosphatase [Eubacterium sp.]|nr:histidinol phosphate phosphatase [Eubacterium sp.]
MKDLHIHIERGEYEKAWIDKFVDRAVKMNIDEINLLEHTIRIREFHPCFAEAEKYSLYQKKWVSEKCKTAHTLDEYKRLIDLIKSSNYPVKINFGLEVCWFEQHEDYIRKIINDCDFDYVLGSVHWVDNWTFNQRKYQWMNKDVNKIYKRYYEMSNTLISSGIFDIIAHPDLIRCHNLFPDYDLTETYESLCENAKQNGVMLEMNTSKGLGVNPEFLAVAKNVGVSFSTGSDAHRPEDVGRGIKEVEKLIK